jgi:hypothetical protein
MPKGYTCMILPPKASAMASKQLLKGGAASGARNLESPGAGDRYISASGTIDGVGSAGIESPDLEKGISMFLGVVENAKRQLANMFERGVQKLKDLYRKTVGAMGAGAGAGDPDGFGGPNGRGPVPRPMPPGGGDDDDMPEVPRPTTGPFNKRGLTGLGARRGLRYYDMDF